MLTPFEQGKIDGQWTPERVADAEFESTEEALSHQEEAYQDTLNGLSTYAKSNPDAVMEQVEYQEGLITATRETLRGQ